MNNNNHEGTIYDDRLVNFVRKCLDGGFARSDPPSNVVMYSIEDEFEEWVLEGIVVKKMCVNCGEKMPITDFSRDRICADFRSRKCQICQEDGPAESFWEDYGESRRKPKHHLSKSRFVIKEDYIKKPDPDDFMSVCDDLEEFALIA